MKFLPAALVLLAVSASSGPAFPAAFPSKVSRVVLYPDSAEVTRTIVVEPPSAVVEISGLPSGIRPDSIAARVTSGEATIAGFTAEDTFRVEPAPEKVLELEKRIETLSDSRRQADDGIRSSRREQELLDQGILALYRGEPDGPSPLEKPARPARLTPAEIEAALALFRGRVDAIGAAILKQEQEIRSLDRRIAAARNELEQVRNPEPLREKKLVIQLSRAAVCRVALTYLTDGAGFSPRYNVRLSPGAGVLAFELVGDAWQRTGEDWTDVALSVSTSRPGRMAQLPPLPPWDIDFRPPPEPRRTLMMEKSAAPMAMMAPGRSREMAAGADEADIPLEAPPMPAPLRRFASFEVTLDGPRTLSGNGAKQSLLIARREQKSAVSWLSIPKVADGAFVTAEGSNATGLPLLQAPAALFLEDAFVGNGFVTDAAGRPADVPEGAAYRIGFGKDPSLQAIRKEVLRQKDEGGVFGRVKRVRYRYEYAVSNFRGEPATLTMLDRIPVAHSKEIEIKDVEAPGAKPGVREPGEVRWELPLAPGEKKVLSLSFGVEYPAEKDVEGL